MLAALPLAAHAGSANFSFNLPGLTPPSRPETSSTPVVVVSPVFTTIQNKTELSTATPAPTEESAAGQAVRPAPPRASIGIDNFISDKVKIYNIPASWSFTPDLQVKLDLPIVTVRNQPLVAGGTSHDETGIGDLSFSVKYRLGSEETLESHTLLTAKFATGDLDKGLGTGSYDIALTQKLIKRMADFRMTLMGGVNQPLNEPTMHGYKITYGTSVSFMGGVEHSSIILPDLWLGARFSGIHAFDSKIDNIQQQNAATIMDVTPEVKYYFGKGIAATLGVIVPVYTRYEDNSSEKRDVTVNVGLFKSF